MVKGLVKFSEFFDAWVHDNYYKNGVNIGKSGDFYTSVSVGYLFGVLHANYFIKCVDDGYFGSDTHVVEIGANEGFMMRDFISGIFTLRPELLDRLKFHIIEPHESLRQKQLQTLQNADMHGLVTWSESLDGCRFDNAFFMSNELFDSFSCELVQDGLMYYVNDGELVMAEQDERVGKICDRYGVGRGEIASGYAEFASTIFASARRLKFLSFDYGEWEFRGDFSIRAYERHDVKNIFETPVNELFGRVDLTYDVAFRYLRDEFESVGLKMSKFSRQNSALIEYFEASNLLEYILKNGGIKAYENAVKQMKFLTSPSFLGERFKFIEFEK